LSNRPSTSFDFSTVSRNTWIVVAGAVVLLISPFLTWYHYSLSNIIPGLSATYDVSGKDATDLWILVFLCALAALAVVGIELFASNVTLPAAEGALILGAGGLATLIVLFKIVSGPSHSSLSYGIFVALIAAVVVAVGGWLKMQEVAQ
jgi:hypothetical protein